MAPYGAITLTALFMLTALTGITPTQATPHPIQIDLGTIHVNDGTPDIQAYTDIGLYCPPAGSTLDFQIAYQFEDRRAFDNNQQHQSKAMLEVQGTQEQAQSPYVRNANPGQPHIAEAGTLNVAYQPAGFELLDISYLAQQDDDTATTGDETTIQRNAKLHLACIGFAGVPVPPGAIIKCDRTKWMGLAIQNAFDAGTALNSDQIMHLHSSETCRMLNTIEGLCWLNGDCECGENINDPLVLSGQKTDTDLDGVYDDQDTDDDCDHLNDDFESLAKVKSLYAANPRIPEVAANRTRVTPAGIPIEVKIGLASITRIGGQAEMGEVDSPTCNNNSNPDLYFIAGAYMEDATPAINLAFVGNEDYDGFSKLDHPWQIGTGLQELAPHNDLDKPTAWPPNADTVALGPGTLETISKADGIETTVKDFKITLKLMEDDTGADGEPDNCRGEDDEVGKPLDITENLQALVQKTRQGAATEILWPGHGLDALEPIADADGSPLMNFDLIVAANVNQCQLKVALLDARGDLEIPASVLNGLACMTD